jgi:hypothetical protein
VASRADPIPTSERWWPYLVFAAGGGWLLALASRTMDGGTWWPIALAPRLWRAGPTLRRDTVSPLPMRGAWSNTQWLTSELLRGVHDVGGYVGLNALAGVFAALVAVLLALASRAAGVGPLPAVATTALAMKLASPYVVAGQLVAELCAAALVVVLVRGRWWLAPLLLMAWANVHGSAAIGVGACLVTAAGACGRASPIPIPAPFARRRVRAAWCGACAAATLLNPLGWGIHTYLFHVRSTPHLSGLTATWSHPHLASARMCLIVVAAGLALVAAARARAWNLVALNVLLAAGAVDADRNVAWLAIIATPCVAASMSRIWVAADLVSRLRGMSETIGVPILGVALVIVGFVGPWQRSLDEAVLPQRLLARIPAHAAVFADTTVADQIVFRRQATVFLDDRFERFEARDSALYLKASDGVLDAVHGAVCGSGPRFGLVLADSYSQRGLLGRLNGGEIIGPHVRLRQLVHDRSWTLLAVACS